MATTVGRVEIQVDADGSGLVRQMRVIGKRAGDEAGSSMGRSLSTSLNRTFTTRDAQGNIHKMSESLKVLDKDITNVGRSSRDTDRHLGGLFKRIGRSHVFKTAAAWTTLFLGAMEGLSVLSSAAGGGLLVLGEALAGVVIGAGIGIVAFTGLFKEIEKLPEAVRPAAEAFQSLGGIFSQLRDDLTTAAFAETTAAWKSLGETIQGLTPAMQSVAKFTGQLVNDFAAAVAPGTELFGEIEKSITNSGPIFDKFVRSVGKLGRALLIAFNNPAMQRAIGKLLGYVDRLFTQFESFVRSERFTEWIDNTERVLGALSGLLDETARMLSNLVTPEAVDRMVSFIDNLSGAMPFLQELFEVFGRLDAFGLIAQILNDVGNALKPILEVLAPIAEIISDFLTLAIDNLAISFGILEAALLPVRVAWEFFAALVSKFVEYITPVQEALQDVIGVIGDTADEIWNALQPAIDEIAQAIIDMLPSPQEFERFLREQLIPKIRELGDWIIQHVIPAIEDFAHWMRDEAVPAMENFWAFVTTYITPALSAIDSGLRAIDLEGFARGVRTAVLIAMGPLGTLLSTILNVIDAFNILAGKQATVSIPSKGATSANGRTRLASGKMIFGPTVATIGESGPEAVVPLRRNLSQVDPSVRWLSAIAQGEMPRMASGGIAGGGRQVIFQSGAIVVEDRSGDPRRTGNEVLRRLAEDVVG